MSVSALHESRPTSPTLPTRQSPTRAPRPAADVGDAREGPSPFAQLVQRLGSEVQSGEALVRGALAVSGGSIGPGELIALQAGVYRYSEAVDLAAQLVDHATSGVKTLLQGQ
jgi:hypothetical protein